MEGVNQKINRIAVHGAGTQFQKVTEYHQNDQDSADIVITPVSTLLVHAAAPLV